MKKLKCLVTTVSLVLSGSFAKAEPPGAPSYAAPATKASVSQYTSNTSTVKPSTTTTPATKASVSQYTSNTSTSSTERSNDSSNTSTVKPSTTTTPATKASVSQYTSSNSGSSSSKPPVTNTNTGNNPGNPNAANYNAPATKTSTTPATKASVSQYTSSNSGSPTNIKNNPSPSLYEAISNIAKAAITIGTKGIDDVSQAAAGAVKPHWSAIQNGIISSKNTAYELSKLQAIDAKLNDPMKMNKETTRAFYKGVHNSYSLQGVPANLHAMPTGPFSDLVKNKKKNLAANDAQTIQQLDQMFRDGDLFAYAPGGVLVGKTLENLTPLALEGMTPVQRLGVSQSTTIFLSMSKQASLVNSLLGTDLEGKESGLATVNPLLGTLNVINTDNPIWNQLNTLYHESTHTGDFIVTADLEKKLANNNLNQIERELLEDRYEAALAVTGCDEHCQNNDNGNNQLYQISADLNGVVKNTYTGSNIEARAFLSELDQEDYEAELMKEEGYNEQEAHTAAEQIKNDPVFQEINDAMNAQATDILGNN